MVNESKNDANNDGGVPSERPRGSWTPYFAAMIIVPVTGFLFSMLTLGPLFGLFAALYFAPFFCLFALGGIYVYEQLQGRFKITKADQ